MKLTTLFIALAMLCMTLEGCDRQPEDGETYGQKIDRGLEKANQAMVAIGDNVTFRADLAGDAMLAAATVLANTAWIEAAPADDAAITASIKTRLRRDLDIVVGRIDVETRNGVVSLRGLAPDEAARERAERIALGNRGVMRVDNRLAVARF